MGMASKRNRDRLLMVGAAAAAVSAVAFYFAWKAFRADADPDDEIEDGEKELQDLETLMKTSEEKGAKAEGVNTYSEEQDGFTVEEFERFIAEEYGKPQAEVVVEDFIRTEEAQYGESGGKFEDSEIPRDGFLVGEGIHLCLTSPSDGIRRFSMENELHGDNHSVNLICSGPCIGPDVCDSGLTERIHGISNGIPDDWNPLFVDFEGFSSSNPGTLLEQIAQQAEFDNISNCYRIQGIRSEDFVTELSGSRDVGYDELSRQKVVTFLRNGVQACDLENKSDVQNGSEFNQTGIDDKGMSCEGPAIEILDFNVVGELAGHLSDDGQQHNHKAADSEKSSDVGISLKHEFDSSVSNGKESLGHEEGLDVESSNSSDVGYNEHPSNGYSESPTVGSSEHADYEIATVCSEKPLDGQIIRLLELGNETNIEKTEGLSLVSPVTEVSSSLDNISDELSVHDLEDGTTSPSAIDSERHLLDDSLESVNKTRDHAGYQVAADSEKSLDGRFDLQPELGNVADNEKMEDLNSVGPVDEASYSAYNGCDKLSSHQLEGGMPSLTATVSAHLDCENDTDLGKHLDSENDTDLGKDRDGQITPEIGFDNVIHSYNELSGIDSHGHPGHQNPAELGKDRTHLNCESDPDLGKDTDGETIPELDFGNIINNMECLGIDSSDSPGHRDHAELAEERTYIDCENVADLGKDTYEEITPELGLDNVINSNSECSGIDSSKHLGDQDHAESGKERTEQIHRKLNLDSSTNDNNIEDLSLESLDGESYNSGNMVFDQVLTNLSEDVQKSDAEISLHPEVDSLNINNHAVAESRSNSLETQSPSCGDMSCDSLSGNVFEDTLKCISVAKNGQFDPPLSTDLGKVYNGQTAILETLDTERNISATESLNFEELKSHLPSFQHMGSDVFTEHPSGVMRSSSVINDTNGDSEKNFGRLNAYDKYLADPTLSPSMKSQVSRARAIAEKLYVSSDVING